MHSFLCRAHHTSSHHFIFSLVQHRITQLYNMETRPKNDASFDALGNMDELNACLALAAEHSSIAKNGLSEMLLTIQSLIIDASALVATPRDSSSARKISRTGFPTWCTDHLEASRVGMASPLLVVFCCFCHGVKNQLGGEPGLLLLLLVLLLVVMVLELSPLLLLLLPLSLL